MCALKSEGELSSFYVGVYSCNPNVCFFTTRLVRKEARGGKEERGESEAKSEFYFF